MSNFQTVQCDAWCMITFPKQAFDYQRICSDKWQSSLAAPHFMFFINHFCLCLLLSISGKEKNITCHYGDGKLDSTSRWFYSSIFRNISLESTWSWCHESLCWFIKTVMHHEVQCEWLIEVNKCDLNTLSKNAPPVIGNRLGLGNITLVPSAIVLSWCLWTSWSRSTPRIKLLSGYKVIYYCCRSWGLEVQPKRQLTRSLVSLNLQKFL